MVERWSNFGFSFIVFCKKKIQKLQILRLSTSYTTFVWGGAGVVSGISLSCDSADLSGSIGASRRKALSSVAQGVWGREVWTAATLLLLWNENLGDFVQPQDKALGGEQGRGREKRSWWHHWAPASSLSLRKTDLSLDFSIMKPINPLCCSRRFEMGPLSHTILSLTDRLPFTETNWVCLYPSQPEIA